jgi:phosphoribosyl 1,2-cyclic phosphate phosphodiesterase
MTNRLLFLGTGSSVGVPVVGCVCPVCHSNSLFNKRLRPSALLTIKNKQFLIDAGPDFREQALRIDLKHLDGILLTHAHHDHTAGIDDLRPIYHRRQEPLPLLLSAETAHDIESRYHYIFRSQKPETASIKRMIFQLLPEKEGVVEFEGMTVHYMTYEQGGMAVNGYRINQLAYLTDIRQFSPSIYTHLRGVKDLIISALRYTPSPLHLSVDEAVDFAKEIRAERVWLTHLSHDLDYEEAMATLPPHVRLAYDGLEITFD